MIESPFTISMRKNCILKLRGFRRDGRPIFYLDESYYHQCSTKKKVWIDSSVVSATDADEKGLSTGLKIPSGKGQRCIMIGIGSVDGWLKIDIFKRTAKEGPLSADYHRVCFTVLPTVHNFEFIPPLSFAITIRMSMQMLLKLGS